MADISSLQNLQSAEPLDWDQYADAKESSPPPPKGRYQVRASEKPSFGATQQGFLSAQIDPTIVGPAAEGYQIRFTKVSAKPFKRGAATVSQLGDFLRSAFGATAAPRPRTPQEQADAVEAAAGRIFQIDGDWEAYCKGCKYTLKGMTSFPKNADGTHNHWVTCPNCKDDDGNFVNLRANFKVDRYVPAS